MTVAAENLQAFHLLLDHLRSIVGRRDRVGLDEAILLAARALLGIEHGKLLRVVRLADAPMVVLAARADSSMVAADEPQRFPAQAYPLADFPEYAACCAKDQWACIAAKGGWRHVVPIFRHGQAYALIELERSTPLSEAEASLLNQLLGLFNDHLNLLDYAETDTLTGLLNRKTFDENLERVLSNAGPENPLTTNTESRRRTPTDHADNWLAVADIDHFKQVNDRHGHIIGDEVLILVARLMRASFRFGDQLFRFGGEEFVMVLQPTTEADAMAVLDRFREAVVGHVFPIVGRVTISVGFTRVNALDVPTELIGRADRALYVAKARGRNRVESYERLNESGVLSDAARPSGAIELF